MTGKDDRIPEDVLKAFEQAAKALYVWDSIGGDEPTVIVDGASPPKCQKAPARPVRKGWGPAANPRDHHPSHNSRRRTFPIS